MKKLKTLKDIEGIINPSEYSWEIDEIGIGSNELREVAKEWIKELGEPVPIYGIPIITAKLKELSDKEFVEAYNLHMRTSAQNILKHFFNLEEEQ